MKFCTPRVVRIRISGRMKSMLLALASAILLSAQSVKMPVELDELSRIAKETVDVTMDSSMLRFAEKFLSEKDSDQLKAKRILRGLNSIYVKTFEFRQTGAYSSKHLDSIRQQLRSPEWTRMVQARDGDDNVEIFGRMQGTDMTGLVVIAAEPRELTIVHLDGPIRPEEVASLSGHAGLPKWRFRVGR